MNNISFGIKYNIVYVYLIHILMAFSGSWIVTRVLFYQEIGLSLGEISIALSLIPITMFLMEIPTGVISDTFGRKLSIVLSFTTCVASSTILLYADGFIDVAIASISYGFSYAFWSGSYESLVFESLRELNKKDEFSTLLSRANFILTFINVGTFYYYSLLFGYDSLLPIKLMWIFGLIMVILSLFLYEPRSGEKISHTESFSKVVNSFKFIKNSKYTFYLMLVFTISTILLGIWSDIIIQPIMKLNFDINDYALIFSLHTFVVAILNYWAAKFSNYLLKFEAFIILISIISISFITIIIFQSNFYLSILLFSIVAYSGTLSYIIFSSELHNTITNDTIRATINSSISMFQSGFYILSLWFFGFFIGAFSLNIGLILLSLLGFLSFFLLKKYNQK